MRTPGFRKLTIVLATLALTGTALVTPAGAHRERAKVDCTVTVGTAFTPLAGEVAYPWHITNACGTSSVSAGIQRFLNGAWVAFSNNHNYQFNPPGGSNSEAWVCGVHASYRGKVVVNGVTYFGGGQVNC